MLKNPFYKASDKFSVKPHISSNSAKDIVAKKLLNTYFSYWGTFALWLFVSYQYIPMIFTLGGLMWIISAIAAVKLPTQSKHIARKTRFTVLTYILGLLAWRMIVSILLYSPIENWEKALNTSLEPAFISAFMGFLSMAFVVGMFMGFVGYLNYIFQLFMFHRSSRTEKDTMNSLLRRTKERGDN